MKIKQKPLTARITVENDRAAITVYNDSNEIAVGPLIHHHLSAMANPVDNINDHLAQLKTHGVNIVAVESELPGVELR